MSRCFPFPPPGHEARPRSEQRHKDLLKEEKYKEKKHRKEKVRGKGERKEKDRDHMKDKHNKKHKKERRRERKKNKDRNKDQKQSLGEEPQKNYYRGHRKPEERRQNEAVKDIKPTDELVTRTFDQEGSKEKERNSLSRMLKKSAEATQDNDGMVHKSDGATHANKKGMGRGIDSKTKIKNGKSHQVGSAEMHFRKKHSCNGAAVLQDDSNAQRSSKDVDIASSIVSGSGREANCRITPSQDTLQNAEEIGPDPVISVHSAKGKTKGGMRKKQKQSVNNCCGKSYQQFVQNKDGEVEGNAKTNYRKANEGKGRDRVVKKRKTEYKNKEKEMEKNGIVSEHKHEDLDGRKGKGDNLMHLGFHNEKKSTSDNIKKRKDFDTKSSLDEHNMKMTKWPTVSPTKDEEIYRHSEQTTPYSSTELLGTNSCEIDRHKPKEGHSNAITGFRCSEEDIASVPSSEYKSKKGHLKQPHPDTKYLSQLYHTPPAQDFSDHINQEWLFSRDRDEQKTAAFEAAEPDQVWSDAQLIDTADVIALPYVIPL